MAIASVTLTWQYTQDTLSTNLDKFLNLYQSGELMTTLQDPHRLLELYITTDPFFTAIMFVSGLAVIHYFVAEMTLNYSQVDKIWSITPALYAWNFFVHDYLLTHTVNPRLLLGSVLVTLWSIRLTYNLARKGGYAWSAQDYRFPYILDRLGRIPMAILNLTFIAPFQNLLLLLLVTPLYFATFSSTQLNHVDIIAASLQLFFLLMESVADEQQYYFQTRKYAMLECVDRSQLQGDYKRGFLSESGLWRFSRHPNFFAEMAIWWSMYLFSVASAWGQADGWDLWLNWTISGAVFLTMVFMGSVVVTERISSERYEEYQNYQRSVSRIIPWLPRKQDVTSHRKQQ